MMMMIVKRELLLYLFNFLDIGENLMNSPSLGEHRPKSYRESQRQQAKSRL